MSAAIAQTEHTGCWCCSSVIWAAEFHYISAVVVDWAL